MGQLGNVLVHAIKAGAKNTSNQQKTFVKTHINNIPKGKRFTQEDVMLDVVASKDCWIHYGFVNPAFAQLEDAGAIKRAVIGGARTMFGKKADIWEKL